MSPGRFEGMLKAIVDMFERGREPIPLAETREIIAFIQAARLSSEESGRPVPLASLA